jgi:hypothetical protein
MNARTSVLALLAFGMALVLLVHFGLIWIYGRFYIAESNTFVLFAETSFIIIILTYSGYCFMRELSRPR